MRATPNPLVETHRVREGRAASDAQFGNNGMFLIPYSAAVTLQVIASDGLGWDHVSVVPVGARNLRKLYRTPTWEEMVAIKRLFFDDDEAAIEFHPARAQYRNAHEYCLHL